jgi:hypothetical protein
VSDLIAEQDERIRADRVEAGILRTVVAETYKRGIVDPAAAAAVIDRSLLVTDVDGWPLNTLEALDTLLEKKPYLVADGRPVRGTR